MRCSSPRTVRRNALLFFCILSFTVSVLLIRSILRDDQPKTSKKIFRKPSRMALIQKVRIFPQGGGDVKFDQPWELPNVKIVEDISELQNGPQRYIVSNFSYSPGLGNLMFQYAALRAIAAKHGARVIVPSGCTLRRGFHLDAVYVSDRLNDKLIHTLDADKHNFKDCCTYNADALDGLFSKSERKFELLIGYFQAFPYFHPDQELLIRDQFRFLAQISKLARSFIAEAKSKKESAINQGDPDDQAIASNNEVAPPFTYVGVHIRHGIDITMNSRNTKHGHTVATKEYLRHAFDRYREKYQHVIFMIATDNEAWAKSNIDSSRSGEVMFVNSGQREVDLATLNYCNHTIMSTGTFSWWAAYLANGETVYYGDWPRPGSEMDRTLNKQQYFIDSWIPMT